MTEFLSLESENGLHVDVIYSEFTWPVQIYFNYVIYNVIVSLIFHCLALYLMKRILLLLETDWLVVSTNTKILLINLPKLELFLWEFLKKNILSLVENNKNELSTNSSTKIKIQ